MVRLTLSLFFAALLTVTSAALAAHGVGHGATGERHDGMSMDGGHAAHEAALAECCDALGAQGGASCLLDASAPNTPNGLSGAMRMLRVSPVDVISSRGISTAVPTGPPKV